MRSSRSLVATVIAVAGLGICTAALSSPAIAQRRSDNSFEIAGRTVRCGNVRILTDRNLPSEGAAADGVLILNPSMLREQPASVRLFVFTNAAITTLETASSRPIAGPSTAAFAKAGSTQRASMPSAGPSRMLPRPTPTPRVSAAAATSIAALRLRPPR
jgi:hypothetical protein